jgi:hypothetical protein
MNRPFLNRGALLALCLLLLPGFIVTLMLYEPHFEGPLEVTFLKDLNEQVNLFQAKLGQQEITAFDNSIPSFSAKCTVCNDRTNYYFMGSKNLNHLVVIQSGNSTVKLEYGTCSQYLVGCRLDTASGSANLENSIFEWLEKKYPNLKVRHGHK